MFAEKPLFLSSSLFRSVASLALSATLFACVIEDAPPRRLRPDDTETDPRPPTAVTGSGSGSTAPPPASTPSSPSPMLAVVDTDQVMNADPGQGVGVFTEYSAGGKWHIWWTCDTARSKQPCDVSVAATAATGTIDAVSADQLQGGAVVTPEPSRLEASIRTTTQVHGITFTTTPGAVLTLEATVGGLKEGPGPNRSFFFFVQDGKINGGYTGALTNPLQLQGNKP
jgi:hypothetical protein